MSAEANKEIVRQYFDRANRGDLEGAFELLAEDFILRGMGMPPLGYERSKDELRQRTVQVAGRQSSPVVIELVGVIAEGDEVAVQAERHDRLIDGATYDNRYHFLCVVRDGRIHRMDEYMCTYSFHNYRQRFDRDAEARQG